MKRNENADETSETSMLNIVKWREKQTRLKMLKMARKREDWRYFTAKMVNKKRRQARIN